MAVAMERMIQPRTTQVSELNEFLVPKILSMNLKKKAEDRGNVLETSGFVSQKNGGVVNTSSELIEKVQKNFKTILDHDEKSENHLETVETAEDEEEVIEMAPERQRDRGTEKQTSYLLQPFLKPVAQNVEGSPGENPILKALFGSNNNKTTYTWVSSERPATNNCHPFKKTELSRDIVHEGAPAQVPKSLMRERQKIHTEPVKIESEKDLVREKEQQVKASSACAEKTTAPPVRKSSHEKENTKPITADCILRQTLSKLSNSRARVGSVSSLKKIGYINSEKLMKLRTLVDNAIKNHKVYSMTGCYASVRNALKQRGWIEKIDSDIKGKKRQNKFEEIGIYDAAFQFVQKYPTLAAMRMSIQSNSGFSHNDQINYSGQGEAEIINRMLRNINEDLCWLSRPYPYYCWKDIGKFDLVNKLPKAYFSNKIGLCNSLQNIQWYFEPGVCSTQYPRTYNMTQKDEYDAFKEDFRMTSCISLLKWLTATYKAGGERAVRSVDGKVDSSIIDFALKRCTEYVKYKEHEDIDLPEGPTVWEYQWDHFITQYYKIINDGHVLKDCKGDTSIQVYVANSLAMLNLIKSYWPQINIDGYQNYWVLKPGGRCCGNGIVIKNNMDQILMMVNSTVTKETRYVVQKYIERPLLIYNTKFDIRQWFLVTSVYPLTVWMYRESYLRFCSQPFSLRNTHESIHLCNNAVQRRYKNSKRDRGLPDENMWDCYTFQTYLKSIGQPDAWDKYIYPGMKEGFIGALLASQDTMERRKNCFELYGADFMISDTVTDGPWLIEINSNPAMDSSTSVTARMCPQVLEDIVKVVIDRRDDKNASTGAFEMVFKQHCPPVPPYLGMSLSIKGQKLHRTNGGVPKQFSKKSKSPNSTGTFLQSETEDSQSESREEKRSEPREQKRLEPRVEKRLEPREEKASEPREEKRSQPRQEKPSEPRQEKPSEPCEEKPSEPCEEKPSEPCEEKPSEPREEKSSECLVPAKRTESKRLGKIQKKAFSAEMIEGLKKEILEATISIKMMNKESRHSLKRHSSEILRATDSDKDLLFQDNLFVPRKVASEKIEIVNKNEEDMAREMNIDDEFLFPDIDADNVDFDEITDYESFSLEGDEYKEEVADVVATKEIKSAESEVLIKRSLPQIPECEEPEIVPRAMSETSLYYNIPDEFRKDMEMKPENLYRSESSYVMCVFPKIKHEVLMESVPPLYLKTVVDSSQRLADVPKTSVECNPQKENTETATQHNVVKADAETSTFDVVENDVAIQVKLPMNDAETLTDLQSEIAQSSTQVDAAIAESVYQYENEDRSNLPATDSYGVIHSMYDKYIIQTKDDGRKKGAIGRKPSWKINDGKKWKTKQKKVDFVQKNIQELKEMQARLSEPLRKPIRARNAPRCLVKLRFRNMAPTAPDLRDYDTCYRDELLNMLESMDKTNLINHLCGNEAMKLSSMLKIKSGHQLSRKAMSTVFSRDGNIWTADEDDSKPSNESDDDTFVVPPICGEIADQLGLKKEGVEVSGSNHGLRPILRKSCPEFGPSDHLICETVIRGISEEMFVEKRKRQGERLDWKSNVDTARKACFEILSTLRDFNESNSKVRLREALKKSVDNQPFGVFRGGRGLNKFSRKHSGRSQQQSSDALLPRGSLKSKSSGLMSVHANRRKKKMEQASAAGPCSPKSDSELAINSENGAVRKVDRTLPKIQQWAFLDGHGLKSSSVFGHRRE